LLGVAMPELLGSRRSLFLARAAALAGLALLLFFALGMHRGPLLSSEIRSRVWPWAPYVSNEPLAAPALSDPVWQFIPWLSFARRELADGRLPLWNPHQDGGVPLLGNALSALGSPLSWPVLLLGVHSGWNVSLLLRILLAGAGAFAWLRELGRSRLASALGASAFAISGPFIAWLEHPQTLTMAPVPLLLLFARRAARKRAPKDVAGLALAAFLVLAGGHPETQLMAALLATGVVAVNARGWRSFLAPAGGALLGAGLAAPMLLPFLEYFRLSAARLGYGRVPFTLPPRDLLRFVLPRVAGSNVIEAAASVSFVLLLLVPIGFWLHRRKRESLFWASTALFFLAVIYSNPISRALAAATPVFWTRFLLFLPLPLAVLGSAGLDSLKERIASSGRSALAGAIATGLVLAAILELLLAARHVHAIADPATLSPTTPLLARLRSDPEVFRILPLHTFLPANSATDYGLDDVRGYDAIAPAGWRAARGAMGGFGDAPTQKDILEPWDLAPGGRALDFWNVKYLLLHPQFGFGPDTLNRRRGLDLEEIYSGPDGRILRNRRVLPRARLNVPGSLRLVERTPAKWRFEAVPSKAGVLLVANPFFPGWRASVDGRRVNLAAPAGYPIAVALPAGRHEVELAYRPASFRIGLALALASAAAVLLLSRKSRSRS
jgi:hypothetical protein